MPIENFRPEIVVLYCEQSVTGDTNLLDKVKGKGWFNARFEVLPCTSKVEISHLLKILERGFADGIQIVGCAEKQCRFLTGKDIAQKRVAYVRSLLDQIRMGAERLGMVRVDGLSAEKLIDTAHERARAVMPLGPNPMKKP